MKKFLLSLISSLFLFFGNAAVIHVDLDATGSNDGSSWANAYNRLQNALANSNNGDDIWIAEGTYYPAYYTIWNDDHMDSTFLIPNGVDVFGGFDGSETAFNQRNLRNNTVYLNGDINRNDQQHEIIPLFLGLTNLPGFSRNVFHVVSFQNSTSTIDGLYVINGGNRYKTISTTTSSDGSSSNSGGGQSGGASSGNPGSGVPVSIDLDVPGNENRGGGVYIVGNSDVTIKNVFFKRNMSMLYGGAVYVGKNCDVTIQNSIFTENFVNKVGIVFADTNSVSTIQHCTFFNNRGGKVLFAGLSCQHLIVNSILWDVGPNIATNNSFGSIQYSITFNETTNLSNIPSNPLLAKPDYYNFEPVSCSPAVDNAQAFFALSTDFYGEPRTGNADIGAIEHSTASPTTNSGSVVYVDTGATGSADGTSWSNAFDNINDAILSAYCNNIKQIWMADGKYFVSDSTFFHSIYLTEAIQIYGGFNGSETSISQRDLEANSSIISGDVLDNFRFPFGGLNPNHLDENTITLLIASPNTNDTILIDGIDFEYTKSKLLGELESGIIHPARFENGGSVLYRNSSFYQMVSYRGIDNRISSSFINTNNLVTPKSMHVIFEKSFFNNNSRIQVNAFDQSTFNLSFSKCNLRFQGVNVLSKTFSTINFNIDSCNFFKKGIRFEQHEDAIINANINTTTFEKSEVSQSVFDDLSGFGAAIALNDFGGNANIEVKNCHFEENNADSGGGAIGVTSHNAFYAANQTAGNVSLNIEASTFTKNRSVRGACVYLRSDENCTFNITGHDILAYKNEVLISGGFLTVLHNGGTVTNNFNNSTFVNNVSDDFASVIDQKDFTGGSGSVSSTFNNSIFYNNYSNVARGPGSFYTAFVDDPKDAVYNHPNLGLNFNYCSIDTSTCYENATCGLGMQYNQNPNFVALAGEIYKLSTNSPALNSGNNIYAAGNLTDREDSTRIVDGIVDLGCYEEAYICALDTILYVNAIATGNNDGSSWANAYTEISDAINLSLNCDKVKEIWVAEGTYYPSKDSSQSDFLYINRTHLKLYGGFPNFGNPTFLSRNVKIYESILSADLLDDSPSSYTTVNSADNSELIMKLENLDSTNVIAGFIFQHARAITLSYSYDMDHTINTNPLIEDCQFRYSMEGSIKINSNVYKMPTPVISRCQFYQNYIIYGGTAILIYSSLNSNGIYGSSTFETDTIKIINCLFHDLHATYINNGFGGAINARAYKDVLPMKITNCTFTRVFGRSAPVLYAEKCFIEIENCISHRNAVFPSFSNTIRQFYANNSTINFYNSSIVGDDCLEKNNITNGGSINCYGTMFYNTDPNFTDVANKDFTLLPTSPLIDMGDNSLISDSLDLKLENRFLSVEVDLGCFEQSSCFPTANFFQVQVDSLNREFDFTSTAERADSVLYDFGDGNTSTQENPTHTFTLSGDYTVCQIAYGDCGNDTLCKVITVECVLPTNNYTYNQPDHTIMEVEFTSIMENADSLFYNFVPNGLVHEVNPTYTFPSPGFYTVCHLGYNECGLRNFCGTVIVECDLPTANFTHIPTSNQAGSFNFVSTATEADSVSYNFGDGTTSSITDPSHTYTNTGDFTVCQYAYGNCGIDTICDTINICSLSEIIYVNPFASGNNDGSSWLNAFETFDLAVNFANSCNYIEEIWMAEGVYKVGSPLNTNRDSSFYFLNKDSIRIYGGFQKFGNPIFSDQDPNSYRTILNGDIGILNDSLDNSYNVLHFYEVKHILLDGLTVKRAYADFGAFQSGALLIENTDASATFKMNSCIIDSNSAEMGSAGINLSAHLVTIQNSLIQNNRSSESAGMYCSLMNDSSLLEIKKSKFLNNHALTQGLFGQGGGAFLSFNGEVKIYQSEFVNNKALDEFGAPSPGGAISIPFSDSLYAENCLFLNNEGGDGGAINLSNVPSELRHCTFYGNQSNQGGFVLSSSDKDVLIRNSIVWNNTSLPFGFGDLFSTLGNNIFLDASFIDIPDCNPFNYNLNCIGANQFNVYPLFMDSNSLDLRLSLCSPAIDYSNSFYSSQNDINGNNRPYSFLPDAGAYEWVGDNISYDIFMDYSSITNNFTQVADYSFTDTLGWTHYYDCDSSNLLLSIKLEGEDIGFLNAGLEIGVNLDTIYSLDLGQNLNNANFHDKDHFYAMNRSWYVSTFQQPLNPVKVRFYFDDVTDLKNVQTSYVTETGLFEINSLQDLVFYKLSNTQNPYDTTTTVNDATIYSWSNTSSLATWTNGTFNNLTYAEFEVSSFSGGTGAATSNSNILPVEMLHFEVEAKENSFIQIEWVTATEINNEGFYLERSLDGFEFKSIGFIEGKGNSTEISNYSFDDKDLEKNIEYYYRLKQVDFDGSFSYSSIKSAHLYDFSSNLIKLYPNPTQNKINVSGAKGFHYQIVDINGKLVENAFIDEVNKLLSLHSLSAGSYLITFTNSEETYTLPLIIID